MKNKKTKKLIKIESQLLINEEIIWQGRPQKVFSISAFETDTKFDPIEGYTNAITSILFFTFFFSILFYMKELYILMVLVILSGIAMLVVPEILKTRRRKETEYLITSERIIFKLWWYGKTSFHSVKLKDLKNVIISPQPSGIGTIYLICKRNDLIDFTTYDFNSGEIRHQPTFELIKDCENVGVLLKDLIRKSNQRNSATNFV